MKSNPKHFLALALLSSITACSASGFTGLETVVSGPISIVDPTSGGSIAGSTAANPYPADVGGFSIGLSEKHYGGPYTVTGYSYTGADGYVFNYSCFDPHIIDSSDQINVVRFQIDGAPTPPPAGQTQGPSPCASGEHETFLIQDTKGHKAFFYLEIP